MRSDYTVSNHTTSYCFVFHFFVHIHNIIVVRIQEKCFGILWSHHIIIFGIQGCFELTQRFRRGSTLPLAFKPPLYTSLVYLYCICVSRPYFCCDHQKYLHCWILLGWLLIRFVLFYSGEGYHVPLAPLNLSLSDNLFLYIELVESLVYVACFYFTSFYSPIVLEYLWYCPSQNGVGTASRWETYDISFYSKG